MPLSTPPDDGSHLRRPLADPIVVRGETAERQVDHVFDENQPPEAFFLHVENRRGSPS